MSDAASPSAAGPRLLGFAIRNLKGSMGGGGRRPGEKQGAKSLGSDGNERLFVENGFTGWVDTILDTKSNPKDRKDAAKKLAHALTLRSEFSIAQVGVAAKTLLIGAGDSAAEYRTLGYDIIESYLRYHLSSVSALNRLYLFEAICKSDECKDFERQLVLVKLLIGDGRFVDGLEEALCQLLSTRLKLYINRSFKLVSSSDTEDSKTCSVDHFDMMRSILALCSDTFKYNFYRFSECDIDLVLAEVERICRITPNEEDLQQCFIVIDTLTRYGYISASYMNNVVEILSTALLTLSDADQKIWKLILNLVESRSQFSIFSSLKHVLLESKASQINPIRGAIKAMRLLFEEYSRRKQPLPTLHFCLDALAALSRRAIGPSFPTLLAELRLMLQPKFIRQFMIMSDWLVVVEICSITYHSYYEKLTDESRSADLGLWEHLLVLAYEDNRSKQLEVTNSRIFDLLLASGSFILPETKWLLLDYFDSRGMCRSANSDWISNSHFVFQNTFANNIDQPQIKDKSLKILMNALNETCQNPNDANQQEIIFYRVLEESQGKDLLSMIDLGSQRIKNLNDGSKFLDFLLNCIRAPSESQKNHSVDDQHLLQSKCLETLATILQQYIALGDAIHAPLLFHNLLDVLEAIGLGHNLTANLLLYLCTIQVDERKRVKVHPYLFAEPVGDEMERGPTENIAFLSEQQVCSPPGLATAFDFGRWLEIMSTNISGLWELPQYVRIFTLFAIQLSSWHIFQSLPSLQKLRVSVCQGLSNDTTVTQQSSPRSKNVSMFLKLTSALLIYASSFAKPAHDEMIQALQTVLQRSQLSAKEVLQTLVIAIDIIPLSVSKYLPGIIVRLSQIITSPTLSVHILEFLGSIAMSPSGHANFTEPDFRRVFGIALQYIQHTKLSSTSNDDDKEPKIENISNAEEFALRQYVLLLAYRVLIQWYLCLRVSERHKYVTWIVKGLSQANKDGKVDEQAESFIDVLASFCYTDLRPRSISGPVKKSEKEITRHWLLGSSILSIQSTDTSHVIITIRRSSGSTSWSLDNLQSTADLPLSMGFADRRNPSEMVKSILLQLYPHLGALEPDEMPILLPIEDSVDRTVAIIDRIPLIDFHKVGVVYVAKGQQQEKEVLSNEVGSLGYVKFLNSIGTPTYLSENRNIYTGGLDTSAEAVDGQFAYYWEDKITQIIFHSATIMPRYDYDEHYTFKKRHIGNNFVTVVYNESGLSYNFDLMRSQFSWYVIVITPIQSDHRDAAPDFFLVTLLCKTGLPLISPIFKSAGVTAAGLASYVRNICIHVNLFSQIYDQGRNEYIPNWRSRLQQITRLRERYASIPTGPHESIEQMIRLDFSNYT